MRKLAVLVGLVLLAATLPAAATNVNIYVDAAPNASGSLLWPAFRDAAYARLAGGTSVNMAYGFDSANVGTTNINIRDQVVYSFGDLGKRLHFFYYVPGETVASLTASNFKIGLFDYWGSDPVYNIYGGTGFVTPSSWVNYDSDSDGDVDGVMGSGGHAWWGAHGVNTQAALDADISSWEQVSERIQFVVQENGSTIATLDAYRAAVPEPLTLAGVILGIGGIGAYIRRRRMA